MKFSRGFTLSIICLFLLGMMFIVINGNSISLYSSVDSIGSFINFDSDEEKSEKIDISNIAYGLDDRINSASISTIALNIERVEVFDGLTIEELSIQLNKSLKGVLTNKGTLIATRCIELGIDPYMAVAIMLHETGCTWNCSTLARINYNVGGMKGRSGKYQKFNSIDEGINAFMNNLYKNYYSKGLTTPETISKKYAGNSTSWAKKIRSYMDKIEKK